MIAKEREKLPAINRQKLAISIRDRIGRAGQPVQQSYFAKDLPRTDDIQEGISSFGGRTGHPHRSTHHCEETRTRITLQENICTTLQLQLLHVAKKLLEGSGLELTEHGV